MINTTNETSGGSIGSTRFVDELRMLGCTCCAILRHPCPGKFDKFLNHFLLRIADMTISPIICLSVFLPNLVGNTSSMINFECFGCGIDSGRLCAPAVPLYEHQVQTSLISFLTFCFEDRGNGKFNMFVQIVMVRNNKTSSFTSLCQCFLARQRKTAQTETVVNRNLIGSTKLETEYRKSDKSATRTIKLNLVVGGGR